MMDEGADSGPIVSQQPILITKEDDARSLYDKVTACLAAQLGPALDSIQAGTRIEPQDESQASYWRKRSPQDGRIDFRMSSDAIYNLVRALTRPYAGATVEWQGEQHAVWRCQPIVLDEPEVEPGRVLESEAGELLIKTANGAVLLLDHEITPIPRQGDYL
jgi:methionyl-tRNA formyltransferase